MFFSPLSGYSVSAGHFLDPQSTEIVGGAPQHEQTGKVRVYTNTIIILFTSLIISTYQGHNLDLNIGEEHVFVLIK